MKILKNLTNIALVGTLALGVVGCSPNNQYEFNGKIGQEKVKFERDGFDNYLVVINKDGEKTEYIDWYKDDLKIEMVRNYVEMGTTTERDWLFRKKEIPHFCQVGYEDKTTKFYEETVKEGDKVIYKEVYEPHCLNERQKEFDSYLLKILQAKNKLPETPKNVRHAPQ